jgi:hypothetical protein
MGPHQRTIQFLFTFLLLFSSAFQTELFAQKRKAPTGGRLAVVVDERLSALRSTPRLSGKLVRRLGRGRLVAIRAARTDRDGIVFLLVNVSSRTHGWIQREAIVSASYPGDDQRLLHLIKSSADYDLIARSRIFLEDFPHSSLRAEVLLLLGDTAEEMSNKLSRDASRRLGERPDFAPEFSYYLNYNGLDRYNRQGIAFVFDASAKRFHYDGAAWREILRRYPKSPEAKEAQQRLGKER